MKFMTNPNTAAWRSMRGLSADWSATATSLKSNIPYLLDYKQGLKYKPTLYDKSNMLV